MIYGAEKFDFVGLSFWCFGHIVLLDPYAFPDNQTLFVRAWDMRCIFAQDIQLKALETPQLLNIVPKMSGWGLEQEADQCLVVALWIGIRIANNQTG